MVLSSALLAVVFAALVAPVEAASRPNSFEGAQQASSAPPGRALHVQPTARSVRGAPDAATIAHAKQRIGVWFVPWDRGLGLASLEANGDMIGEVSPFWFELRPRARLRAATGAYDADVLDVAHAHDMVVLPTISNSFETSRVTWMLRTDRRRLGHVRSIVDLVVARGYDGIDIDYENLAPADRMRFSRFVFELGRALHARGRLLSVTVMAKTRDAGHSGATASMDYRAIGDVADQVRIMAYDYHWSCGAPGPVAPADWVEDVVSYAVTRIDREKVVLGVPFYGYDWPRSGCATARTWQESNAIIGRFGSAPRFNVRWKTHVLTYLRRQLWYDEWRSLEAKSTIARQHGIRGIFAWRLGGEDPKLWNRIAAVLGAHVVVEHPRHR